MNQNEIIQIINARNVTDNSAIDAECCFAFASDLMSDVLTVDNENIVLITGLANTQVIRTAEMADISCVILARGKKATNEMIQLATENQIMLIECEYSMFKISGLLYNAGLKPLF